ncbi:lipid A-modifier LpxR family protein [Roseovarius nanhaiticus]|uniref:lipid A-modifier LpxR family protein n=1 Tax=Roseovarius nanhaiticus TaxID=573024 RepID=UPI002490966F|nr:lipid A-modifier LpxR family protein [Roseovarius nanhaiticus]
MRSFVAASLAMAFILGIAAPAASEGRVRLGYGRLVTNDFIGDGFDRWRTGAVASSRVWGPSWDGGLPKGFGQLLELRLNAQIIAPQDLNLPAAGDRPYAGSLSVGLHTHYEAMGAELSLGGDLVFVGPQTGLDGFQDFIHDNLGGQGVGGTVRRTQIGDDIRPTAVMEVGHSTGFGSLNLRPFAEARAGDETLVRVGADLTIGTALDGGLMVRAPVSGQRYRAVNNGLAGYAFVLGADTAYVEDSVYLPESSGFRLSDARNRVRAGVHYAAPAGHRVFYGVTWLDREFKGQEEGQFVGSLRLHLEF